MTTRRTKTVAAASRLGRFTESVIREQTRLARVHEAVNLAQGFPDFPCPPELKELSRRAIDEDHNQYSITWGLPGLRAAIAKKAKAFNGIVANPETEVTVTCGSTEAMMCAFLGLVDPGKEVILFQPFYENYQPDSYLSGAKPVHVAMHPDARTGEWTFDEKELARAFGPRTAAVVITTPHNPTGKVFSRAELEIISKLCQKWGAKVFSDEIYEHIVYEGRHVSPASVPGLEDRTVTINSASKTYGVTGWRVGWAIAPAPLSESMRKVHDFLTVCAATPLQTAVQGALALPASYYRGMAAEYRERREFILKGLTDTGFKPFKPRGAYYVMADASAHLGRGKPKDDTELARLLVEEIGVAAVPGSSFYRAGKQGRSDLLRFCFCKKEETLTAAVERLKKL
ncbi:MAG TPA: aminotransferase class I/II-fold pyridoxal phosphate-dependent enzyme [Fibrobacteria bacterium]|jgi:aminotransferase|nr:aminotransferase class I/II-fold pyridoxal phosphate-dependent enzyme [Fibrobacteria bacterium]